MKKVDSIINDLCEEIDYLTQELNIAKATAEYWEKKYDEQVRTSISQGEVAMTNILKILCTTNVAETFITNSTLEK